MTRDKSDAQLDAEASAPPPDLTAQIAHHRAMYRAELRIPLTTSRVPSDLESIDVRRRVDEEWLLTGESLAVLDAGELGGPSLSPQMVARLSEPPYGASWAAALFALRHTCRSRHPDHQGPKAWRGSLCHRLVWLVIVGERALAEACARMGLEEHRTQRTLATALRFIEAHIEVRHRREVDRKAREEQRVQQVGTLERAWEHHAVPGLHAEECPQCRKSNIA